MTQGLDIEQPLALEAWLREKGYASATETVESRMLRGGVSNRTVLVRFGRGECWVLKQALPKLRVPVDWFCAPERIEREAQGMAALWNRMPDRVPRLIFCEPAVHLLAMEAVPEPHRNWKSMLMAGETEIDHFRQFGRLLRTLRETPAGPEFADRGYFEALRLEPYYGYTGSQVPEAAPFLCALADRTRSQSTGLVHGDFSPKNVLVREGRLILLDHEVIHSGDPAFDVGFAMAHFLSKARHLPASRERILEGALAFLEAAALDGPEPAAHTLACCLARVAGRSQLEYLSEAEKAEQRAWVLAWLGNPPDSVSRLIELHTRRQSG